MWGFLTNILSSGEALTMPRACLYDDIHGQIASDCFVQSWFLPVGSLIHFGNCLLTWCLDIEPFIIQEKGTKTPEWYDRNVILPTFLYNLSFFVPVLLNYFKLLIIGIGAYQFSPSQIFCLLCWLHNTYSIMLCSTLIIQVRFSLALWYLTSKSS